MESSLSSISADLRLDDSYPVYSKNPDRYAKKWGISLQKGELLQKVHISKVEKNEQNESVEKVDQLIPNYLPIRCIFQGKEDQTIEVKTDRVSFFFTCNQKNNTDWLFEGALEEKFKKMRHFSGGAWVFQKLDQKSYQNVLKRLNDSNPGEIKADLVYRLFLDANRPLKVVTNRTLRKKYHRKSILGGGGEGRVYEVTRKKHQEVLALKVSTTYPYPMGVLSILNHLLHSELTSHLTRIERVFRAAVEDSNCQIFYRIGERDFLPDRADGKEFVSIVEMELLEGDLNGLPYLLSKDKAALWVQYYSARDVLRKYSVFANDSKTRNIFYRQLLESDQFRGKKMMKADFWRYEIEGTEFYIPRLKYVIKIGDFDGWSTNLFNGKQMGSPVSYVNALTVRTPYGLEQIKSVFSKPKDKKALVINMA